LRRYRTGAAPPLIAWPEQAAADATAAAAAAAAAVVARTHLIDFNPGPLLAGAIVRCRAAAARPADEAEHGNILRQWPQISLAAASGVAGRGLHPFTFQLNLSRVKHTKTPYIP
jgi:hypothetical protein